jgi:ABC-type nickel/cobalt efflux system permease component RcnA
MIAGEGDSGLGVLAAAVAATGFLHTLLGPDHVLPFVAMARAGRWSLRRTLAVTALCGAGHVAASVALGLLGLVLGLAAFRIERLDAIRGDLAGWLLLGFGIAYLAWGIRRAIRRRPHAHLHAHEGGLVHRHPHVHEGEHVHVHESTEGGRRASAPWVLFTVLVFGPCEPLVPLFLYPAASGRPSEAAFVAAAFAATTIATMTALVAAGWLGARALPLGRVERYAHACAGAVFVACGLAVKAGL